MGRHAATKHALSRTTRIAVVGAGAVVLTMVPLVASGPASATVPGKVQGSVRTTDVTRTVVNGNHYALKSDVYISGGPTNLAAGDYFFAVLAPGGQSDPNDAGPGNLSDDVDAAAARTFHIDSNGIATALTGTTHTISPAGVIQLWNFADTPNPGGVYIVAVCQYAPVGADGTAPQTVNPSDCKYDAFKVDESVQPPPPPVNGQNAPTAVKTAIPTHTRTVSWTILKLADGASSQYYQAASKVVTYTVTATKSATEAYGVTGVITVYNSNADPLDVTVTEDGLVPSAGSCSLDSSGSLTVPAKDSGTNDPGHASVPYTCTFTSAPDGATDYTNTATVTYNIGASDQDLPVASDPFNFPAATLTAGSAPETIHVTDAFNGGSGAALSPATTSDTYTWTYPRTLTNSDCHTYPNTATITETSQTSSTSVTLCGPNSGGLTQGWWQNKNGQTLLKNNLTAACSTVNGYLPATFTHGANTYLPDAYTGATTATNAGYYVSSSCTGPTNAKSYLPTFDTNVFNAAAAVGTGTKMVESQWLTTTLDTATYTVSTSAGKPTLQSGEKVVIPAVLQSALGLSACDTIANAISAAATQYASYAATKTTVTTSLITLFDNLNNNKAQTCL